MLSVSKKEPSKCVFRSCPNTVPDPGKPGIYFFTFNSVPPSVRDEWIRIVARERGEPSFEPKANSIMCYEHFTPRALSKLCKIKIQNLVARSLVPTINIDPYEDVILIKDDDVRDASRENDVVCIIENQIRTEVPEPQFTNEQEIDIEDQIQFSLVGKTNHFDGLITSSSLETPKIEFKNLQNSENGDVVIIEDDNEIENSGNESEYSDQFSQFLKQRNEQLNKQFKLKEMSDIYTKSLISNYQTLSTSKQLTETKNPAHLLRRLLTRSPPLPSKTLISTTSQAQPRPLVAPQSVSMPQYVKKSVSTTESQSKDIQEENDVDDDVIIVAEDIEFDVSDDEVEQKYTRQYSQFLKKLNAGSVTKEKRWNSVEPKKIVFGNSKIDQNNEVETKQQTIPTSLVTLQQFATAPLLVASPMLAHQTGTVQQLFAMTPITATNSAQQVATPQLVALIPSNGVQQKSLCLQDNNLQPYYISPFVSPTPHLVIDSGQVVIKKDNKH